MKPKEWFRKTTWTESDQQDFFKRLGRARASGRAQYLRIQAGHLEGAELLLQALELLDLLLRDYPDDLELAMAHLQKAHCLTKLGKEGEAIKAYQAVIQRETEFPKTITDAWLDFGWFVVSRKLRNLYTEVLKVLSLPGRRLMFPIDHYRSHGIRAIIEEEKGNQMVAREFAIKAIAAANTKHSEFHYHKDVGLVSVSDSDVHAQLVRLADKA